MTTYRSWKTRITAASATAFIVSIGVVTAFPLENPVSAGILVLSATAFVVCYVHCATSTSRTRSIPNGHA